MGNVKKEIFLKINIEIVIIIAIIVLVVVVLSGFFIFSSGTSITNIQSKESLVSGCFQWQQTGCDPEQEISFGEQDGNVKDIYDVCSANGINHCFEYCCQGKDIEGP